MNKKEKKDKLSHRICFRLTEEEYNKLVLKSELAGYKRLPYYVRHKVLDEPAKMEYIDKSELDYLIEIGKLVRTVQGVGINYGLVYRSMTENFGKEKGLQLMQSLNKQSIEFMAFRQIAMEQYDKLKEWLLEDGQ